MQNFKRNDLFALYKRTLSFLASATRDQICRAECARATEKENWMKNRLEDITLGFETTQGNAAFDALNASTRDDTVLFRHGKKIIAKLKSREEEAAIDKKKIHRGRNAASKAELSIPRQEQHVNIRKRKSAHLALATEPAVTRQV